MQNKLSMRAEAEHFAGGPESTMQCPCFPISAFNPLYHFHPELELALVFKDRGRRFVGDDIAPFSEGDLVLIGPNLPHLYRSDPHQPPGKRDVGLILLFRSDILGNDFLNHPAAALTPLLKKSVRGISFHGPVRDRVAAKMRGLREVKGLSRAAGLLYILDELAHAKDYQLLASPGFAPLLNQEHAQRLNRVIHYVLDNSAREITQAEAARMASLSPAAFSRFFRKSTWTTFETFVNEIRIGNACRMLIEEEESVTEICGACGFTNISNFNRRFRELKKMSPREFRKAFQVNN
jgi:AraC-like DNA-binding protein